MKYFISAALVLGFCVLAATFTAQSGNLNTSGRCPGGPNAPADCSVGHTGTSSFSIFTDNDVQVKNTATGNVSLDFRDYADTADDDMAHSIIATNCTTATTGAEECDMNISITTGGANVEAIAIDPAGAIEIGDATTTYVQLTTESAYATVDSPANTLKLTAATTNTATFQGGDAAGDANTLLDTTGAGTITIGTADVTSVPVTTDGGTVTIDGTIASSANDLGWAVVAGADTACTTTCTSACVFGVNTAATEADIVDCADATADECLCAGGS